MLTILSTVLVADTTVESEFDFQCPHDFKADASWDLWAPWALWAPLCPTRSAAVAELQPSEPTQARDARGGRRVPTGDKNLIYLNILMYGIDMDG